jgi:putative glutamine amidotransferase
MHHQAVRDLAEGLTACALAPDGLIEALEMPGYPWLVAVQWHPEYLREDPANFCIFKHFVAACPGR